MMQILQHSLLSGFSKILLPSLECQNFSLGHAKDDVTLWSCVDYKNTSRCSEELRGTFEHLCKFTKFDYSKMLHINTPCSDMLLKADQKCRTLHDEVSSSDKSGGHNNQTVPQHTLSTFSCTHTHTHLINNSCTLCVCVNVHVEF